MFNARFNLHTSWGRCTQFLTEPLLFLSRETETCVVEKSKDSLSIHSSSPRGSITFRFLAQLKDAYLCKGKRHQLLLHHSGKGERWSEKLSVVQLEFALILLEDKTCIFPYPWGSKFSSSSRAWKVLNFGTWRQDLVMLHEVWKKLWLEKGDWKGSR